MESHQGDGCVMARHPLWREEFDPLTVCGLARIGVISRLVDFGEPFVLRDIRIKIITPPTRINHK